MSADAIKKTLKGLFFCLLLYPSLGMKIGGYFNSVTEDEVRLLPHYLEVKVRSFLNDKPDWVVRDYKLYSEKFGSAVYSPLHHYGMGLIYMHRVKTRAKYLNRGFDIRSAIGEFSFVIKGSPPYSFILYEVYYKRGEAFLYNEQLGEAMKDFYKVTTMKPDFLDAYVMLSECYRKNGDLENAEKWLKLGQSRAGQKQKVN